MDYNKFQKLIRKSIRYEFLDEGILEITHYYTGDSIRLDLTQLSEEAFEEIKVEEE